MGNKQNIKLPLSIFSHKSEWENKEARRWAGVYFRNLIRACENCHRSLEETQAPPSCEPSKPSSQPSLKSAPSLFPSTSLTYLHWRQSQRWYQRAGCALQTGSWWQSSEDHWRPEKWSAEPDTHRTSQLGSPRQRGGESWQYASQLRRSKAAVR